MRIYEEFMTRQEQWLSEFGQRVKAERLRKNMTQHELGSKAHTKQDYIAQIEKGARNPSFRTLVNILSALDVSADYLIYGTGAINNAEDEREVILKDFISFLSRKSKSDIMAYYNIVKYLSKNFEVSVKLE